MMNRSHETPNSVDLIRHASAIALARPMPIAKPAEWDKVAEVTPSIDYHTQRRSRWKDLAVSIRRSRTRKMAEYGQGDA